MQGSFRPIEIEEFGGLVSNPPVDPHDVVVGRSPDCLNVDFQPGQVATRPGTTLLGSLGSAIMSMKEFTLLDSATRRLLILTASGTLSKETGDSPSWGTVSTIESFLGTSVFMRSTTLFGKEWMGFSSDGKLGDEYPRVYNDVNLDRLTAEGPGDIASMVIINNGVAGDVSKGTHKFRVIFVRRNGAFSISEEKSFVSIGGEQISGTGVPVGPADVVERIVVFSRAGDTRLFYVPGSGMEIKNNTATTFTAINFTDRELGAAVSVDHLLDAMLLPETAGIVSYNNKLVAWGVRNAILRTGNTGFRNLSFSGGFSGGLPLGWTQVTAGGSKSNPSGSLGDSYRITGDGASQRGALQNRQLAYPLLEPGKAYRARYRVRKSLGLTGTFHVYLVDFAGGLVSGTTTDASAISATTWTWIDAELVSAAGNVPDAQWALRISGGGGAGGGTVLSNGGTLDINGIEIYPADEPVLPSLLYVSETEGPEEFDGLRGLVSVAENNGQAVRQCFVLRNNLYVVKERSLWMTNDNGLDPIEWQVENVSTEVGSPSMHGADTTDGWAIIAGRAGVHFFGGGRPLPISEEILGVWKRINWAAGHRIWVRIDNEERRIFVGIPIDGSTTVNRIMVCRWFGDSPLADRHWAPWTGGVIGHACAFSERSDGKRFLLFGSAAGSVVKLDTTTPNDSGAAIDAYYQTAFLGRATGRLLHGYLTASVAGAGALGVTAFWPNGTTQTVIPAITLYDPPPTDYEWLIRVKGERISYRWGSNAVDSRWRMKKFTPYAIPAPHAPLRGLRE